MLRALTNETAAKRGVQWQSETAQDGCATAQGLILFFKQKTASSGAKMCHKCGAVNPPHCPSLLGPRSPPQTAHQLPPQLGWLLPKTPPPASPFLGRKAQPILGGTGAQPCALRSPSPAAQLAAASTVLIGCTVQETSGTGDNFCCPANAGVNISCY